MTEKNPASHDMVVALIESGAPNYYTERVAVTADGDQLDVEVIARYVEGETPSEQLAVAQAKLQRYEVALGRIAEGMQAPMLLARAVLSGAPGDIN